MNIFNEISGMQGSKVSIKEAKIPSNLNIQADLISKWKKNRSEQLTNKVVEYLKPTIQSALHSYAPGQQQSMRTKATILALQSLQKYDPSSKASPKTYVFTSLQRLNRLRRQRQNIIHIPQNQVYIKNVLDTKAAQLQQELGRQPTNIQLSQALKMSVKKLQKIQNSLPGATFSSTASLNQEGHQTLGKSDLSDRDFYNYVYDSVQPIDKKIMQWTSGYSKKPLSNNQIAKKLKLSPGAVSQRKLKIQQKLSDVRGLL